MLFPLVCPGCRGAAGPGGGRVGSGAQHSKWTRQDSVGAREACQANPPRPAAPGQDAGMCAAGLQPVVSSGRAWLNL